MDFTKDWPVEILWEDTYAHAGWNENVEEYCEEAKDYQFTIRTVGFIVLKNKKKIIVSMSLTRTDCMGDMISIPRKNIISILKLKPSAENYEKRK